MIDTVSFWNFCEKFGPKVVIIYLTTKFFLKNRFFYTLFIYKSYKKQGARTCVRAPIYIFSRVPSPWGRVREGL